MIYLLTILSRLFTISWSLFFKVVCYNKTPTTSLVDTVLLVSLDRILVLLEERRVSFWTIYWNRSWALLTSLIFEVASYVPVQQNP